MPSKHSNKVVVAPALPISEFKETKKRKQATFDNSQLHAKKSYKPNETVFEHLKKNMWLSNVKTAQLERIFRRRGIYVLDDLRLLNDAGFETLASEITASLVSHRLRLLRDKVLAG